MLNKPIATLGLLFFCSIILSACFAGYTTDKGQVLKRYLQYQELKELTENPRKDIRIIDVRPGSAYKKGHIPTAESFPSSEIMQRLSELPKDKSYILYCETGGRAQGVLKKLIDAGYENLMNWGGVGRWEGELVK